MIFDSLSANEQICITGVFFTIFLFCYWYRRPSCFPPGPRGIPLIGVVPFLGKYPERTYKKWSKTYGPILSARLGGKETIVLNSFDVIQQAFVKQSTKFSGRPHLPFQHQFTNGLGLVFADYGNKWNAQRKFGFMTLRGFGVGKQSMESKILEEASRLIEEMQAQNGQAFDTAPFLLTAIANVISSVTLGKRFDYEDPNFQVLCRFIKTYDDPLTNLIIGLFHLAPFLMKLPLLNAFNQKIVESVKPVQQILDDIIEEHRETLNNSELRDFIDAFLLEIKKGTDESFSEEQLSHYIRELFFAGSETTSSTLYWSLLCLLHYPQFQSRMRKEILDVIGQEGKIAMEKRTEMPFTSAFVEEVFRFRTLVPLGIVHAADEDVVLKNYVIPKGTPVSANLWAVHNDENLWEKPEIFNPDRFLNEKGNFARSPNVIPFSVGPRRCLGEQLARMEYFIFLVSLVRRFEFLPDPNANGLPEIEDGSNGLLFVAKPCKLVAMSI